MVSTNQQMHFWLISSGSFIIASYLRKSQVSHLAFFILSSSHPLPLKPTVNVDKFLARDEREWSCLNYSSHVHRLPTLDEGAFLRANVSLRD